MKYYAAIFLYFSCAFLLHAQGFQLQLNTNLDDNARRIFEAPSENGYFVIYDRDNDDPENRKIGITKIDLVGNIVWEKLHDASHGDLEIMDILIESDGIRIAYPQWDINSNEKAIINNKYDFNGELADMSIFPLPLNSYAIIVKLLPDHSVICIAGDNIEDELLFYNISQTGELIWVKDFSDDFPFSFICNDVQPTSDGGFVLLCQDFIASGDAFMIKLNSSGDVMWSKDTQLNFGFDAYTLPFPDGSTYFAWGEIYNGIVNETHTAGVANDGQLLWSENFVPHANYVERFGVIPGENNSLYMTGNTYVGTQRKQFLLQLGNDGNIIWERRYVELPNNIPGQLMRANDGGLYVATMRSGDSKPFVLKTDSTGEPLWDWVGPQLNYYQHIDATPTSDGGLIVLGNWEIGFTGLHQCFLAKINADGSVYTNHITGELAFDESQSCSYEDEELPLGGWKIKATSLQNTYATTLHDGSFWLSTNDDSVLLSTVLPNACWTNCPEPVYALFSTPSDTAHVELFVQATKNCPILEVSASAPFLRRCFNNTYTIHCENTGTIPSENTQLKVYLDPLFEYVSANATLVSQNGVEYIFEVGTLDVGESYTFHLSVTVSCDAELGQEHCLSVIAVADNTCPDVDNSLARTRECQPNIGSFDPNDKRAFSEGKLIERFIAADSLIEYQIRFQNTGTDTAFTVVIADTLSSLLDIESIRAGAASHAYRMELEQNNILKFVFNDIMLPDSNVNEPASNGFVKFSIRHRTGLVPGDVIPNKAAIYFDFNEAVITNNLELEIEDPTSVGHARQPIGQRVLVYPQPAHDVVVFERLDEPGHQSCRLQIMNLLGQVIYDQPMSGAVQRVQGLPTGQHFYRLRQNGETLAVGKLVVAK